MFRADGDHGQVDVVIYLRNIAKDLFTDEHAALRIYWKNLDRVSKEVFVEDDIGWMTVIVQRDTDDRHGSGFKKRRKIHRIRNHVLSVPILGRSSRVAGKLETESLFILQVYAAGSWSPRPLPSKTSLTFSERVAKRNGF